MTWLVLTDDQVIDELRERCRSERLAQNLSQGDLAERAGLSRGTVARFENDSNTPGLETLVAILRVLGGLEALEHVLPPRPSDPLSPGVPDRQRATARRDQARPNVDWPRRPDGGDQ